MSDSYLEVIQLFENDTRFKDVLGEAGEFAHFTATTGLAMDDRGRLYIAEMLANKVSVYQILGATE